MDLKDFFVLDPVSKELRLLKPYAEIRIPEEYMRHGISSIIADKVETFGLFEINVWDSEDITDQTPIKISFSFPSVIRTCPDRIEQKKIGDDSYYVLEYLQGDAIIESTLLAKNAEVPKLFMAILFNGYIPDSLSYDEVVNFWAQCNSINSVNLKVKSVVMQAIIAAFARDPKEPELPFRIAINDPKKKFTMLDRKFIRVMDLPRLNSTFASISSSDPKQGITASIVRRRTQAYEAPSPVEEAIL